MPRCVWVTCLSAPDYHGRTLRAHDVPTGAQRSAGRLIAAMMLVCAVVSILRTYLLGGIVHDPQDLLLLHYVWTETAFLCAIAIAGVTYLRVLRSPNKPPLRTALRLSCLIHVCAAFALPYTSYDVLLNLAYGRLLSLGLNPYRYSPSALPAGDPFILDASSPWSSHVSVWGPISVLLSRLGVIFENLWLSVLLMKFLVLVISIAILLLAFWLAKRSTEAHHSRDAFLFVAWNPLFAWELSGQAHRGCPTDC